MDFKIRKTFFFNLKKNKYHKKKTAILILTMAVYQLYINKNGGEAIKY